MKVGIFNFTPLEYNEIIDRHFDKDRILLKNFPSKEKRKAACLLKIIETFECNWEYTEKEVNDIIKPIYADFSTIRRYLVDYKLLKRSADGQVYQRT